MKTIHSITNWEIRGSLTINMWELWTERGGTWYLHEVNKNPSLSKNLNSLNIVSYIQISSLL